MSPTDIAPHPSRDALDRELREVKDNVLRMGMLVEDQIRAAIKALVEHDAEAALAVIIGDGRINEAQRQASTLIARTIATQGPVARDLRFLLSLDHVTYELERIGDHAASVAKQARKLAPEPPLQALPQPAGDGRSGRDARPRDPAGARRHRPGRGPRGRGPRRRDRRPVSHDLRRGGGR